MKEIDRRIAQKKILLKENRALRAENNDLRRRLSSFYHNTHKALLKMNKVLNIEETPDSYGGMIDNYKR